MNRNKLLKVLAAFVLSVTILTSSTTVSIADTIDECSYLVDMGSKSYSDTLFYEYSSSFFDDSEFDKGCIYFVVTSGEYGFVEYIDFGDRDECHQWIAFKNDPRQICLDCYDTFVTNILLVVDTSSNKVYTYSDMEDNYIEFILNMSK
ncbi:MAG: hypothetical protein Q4E18_04695 [Clostridia bacterium]|nr:hypothetical protein [Clostridia bacterium]